jgi:hypothetical protein
MKIKLLKQLLALIYARKEAAFLRQPLFINFFYEFRAVLFSWQLQSCNPTIFA